MSLARVGRRQPADPLVGDHHVRLRARRALAEERLGVVGRPHGLHLAAAAERVVLDERQPAQLAGLAQRLARAPYHGVPVALVVHQHHVDPGRKESLAPPNRVQRHTHAHFLGYRRARERRRQPADAAAARGAHRSRSHSARQHRLQLGLVVAFSPVCGGSAAWRLPSPILPLGNRIYPLRSGRSGPWGCSVR